MKHSSSSPCTSFIPSSTIQSQSINLNLTYISIFTFFGLLLELWSLWSYRRENTNPIAEKHAHGAATVPHNGHDGPTTAVP